MFSIILRRLPVIGVHLLGHCLTFVTDYISSGDDEISAEMWPQIGVYLMPSTDWIS